MRTLTSGHARNDQQFDTVERRSSRSRVTLCGFARVAENRWAQWLSATGPK
jgi:hypothetical protein